MKDTNNTDFNEINAMVINKIKIELEKDLSPNELNSIARLALAFQKRNKRWGNRWASTQKKQRRLWESYVYARPDSRL